MNIPIPPPLRRLDRSLLLSHPHLWATKAHYVLFFSALALCATNLIAFLVPVSLESVPYTINYVNAMACFLPMAWLVWFFVRSRQHTRHSFRTGSSGWTVPLIDLICLAAIDCLPFVFAIVLDYRVAKLVDRETFLTDCMRIQIAHEILESDKLATAKSKYLSYFSPLFDTRALHSDMSDETRYLHSDMSDEDQEWLLERFGPKHLTLDELKYKLFEGRSAEAVLEHTARKYARNKSAVFEDGDCVKSNLEHIGKSLGVDRHSWWASRFVWAELALSAALALYMVIPFHLLETFTLRTVIGSAVAVFFCFCIVYGTFVDRSRSDRFAPRTALSLFLGVYCATGIYVLISALWGTKRTFLLPLMTAMLIFATPLVPMAVLILIYISGQERYNYLSDYISENWPVFVGLGCVSYLLFLPVLQRALNRLHALPASKGTFQSLGLLWDRGAGSLATALIPIPLK